MPSMMRNDLVCMYMYLWRAIQSNPDQGLHVGMLRVNKVLYPVPVPALADLRDLDTLARL